jgi:DNA recombination protein RmuC
MTAAGVVVALLGLVVGFAAGAVVVLRSNGFFQRLSRVTNTLERTLASPTERGTWGEVKLRQVVELAGMEQWCDFDSQVVLPGGVGRPDLVVRVPGDRRVIVDAKATLDARGLRARMRDLAAKRYWELLPGSLDFVVLFIPLDPVLSSALQQDPSLLDEAASLNVIFATPATLLAILRFVAHGWRQETFAKNALVVRQGAEELYSRLAVVQGHMTALGRHLRQSVDGYNKVVASVDGRLLPSARKMHQLGIGAHELEPVAPVEATVRKLRSSRAGGTPGQQEQVQDDHDEIGIDWAKALADLEEQDP